MKKRQIGLLVAVACMFFLPIACNDGDDKPPRGSKLGECYLDGTCDGSLTCVSGICVDLNEISDVDANTDDNGPADDGTTTDVEGTEDIEQPDTDNYVVPDDIGTMVDIPAGEFWMGCNEAVDDQCENDEFPYHAVTLSAYKMGKYEVTVGEYQKCVTNGACNNSNGNEPHYYTNIDSANCDLGAEGNHPMPCVTWYGAKAYCEWMGGRLPTEAEWEKAARGTDGQKYPWGNEPTVSCDYAVMDDPNAGGDGCGTGDMMPVGSKPNGVSPYGVYDMIGNVWEWVNDWYDEDYYTSSPASNPAGPETGALRVMRGGAWGVNYRYDTYLRASSRYGYDPAGAAASYTGVGFRCAK